MLELSVPNPMGYPNTMEYPNTMGYPNPMGYTNTMGYPNTNTMGKFNHITVFRGHLWEGLGLERVMERREHS